MELTKEELEKRKLVEEKLYAVYRKSFAELFNSCMNRLPQETDLAATAFQVNKGALIVKACREVLEKYETALYNQPDPSQTKMEFKDGQEES